MNLRVVSLCVCAACTLCLDVVRFSVRECVCVRACSCLVVVERAVFEGCVFALVPVTATSMGSETCYANLVFSVLTGKA